MLSTSRAGVVNENRMWWRISGGRVENDGVVDTGWGLRAMSVTAGEGFGGKCQRDLSGSAGTAEATDTCFWFLEWVVCWCLWKEGGSVWNTGRDVWVRGRGWSAWVLLSGTSSWCQERGRGQRVG